MKNTVCYKDSEPHISADESEYDGLFTVNKTELIGHIHEWFNQHKYFDTDTFLKTSNGIVFGHLSQQHHDIVDDIAQRHKLIEYNENPAEIGEKDDTPSIVMKLGNYLNKKYRFIATSENSAIWVYDDKTGIYKDSGLELLNREIMTYLNKIGLHVRTHVVREIQGFIRGIIMDTDRELSGPPNRIVMRNGIFDLSTFEFSSEFAPDEYHITGIPVLYDPDATCERFDRFLEETINDENDRLAIIEFLGYCLIKDYRYAICLILYGDGSNGKSTLLNVLESFVGKNNVSGVTPQELDERFSKAELFRKLVNKAGDITDKPIIYTSYIKNLTGNDLLQVERKNRDPFTFRNYAKLIFSANKIPASYDNTKSFHRRMRIITFPNTFPNDDTLLDTLTTETELSGIFNLAIEGWKRLYKNKELTGEKSVDEKHERFALLSNPIEYFTMKFLSQSFDEDSSFAKSGLYRAYCYLCRALKETPRSDNSFGRSLKRYATYIDDRQIKTSQGVKSFWIGLDLDFDGLKEFIESHSDVSDVSAVFSTPALYRNPYDTGGPETTETTETTEQHLPSFFQSDDGDDVEV